MRWPHTNVSAVDPSLNVTAMALLDFQGPADLAAWLTANN